MERDMSKEFLGVEFYRNFVGIEKLLKIKCDNKDVNKGLKNNSGVYEFIYTDGAMPWTKYEYLDFSIIKPYLKLPEDLTDGEILWVVFGDELKDHKEDYEEIEVFKYSGGLISVIGDGSTHLFEKVINSEIELTQEQFNRMRELHCDPKAKEYIEKGLAIKIEVKNEP